MVVHEELLKLLSKLLSQVVDVFYIGPTVILSLNGYDAIIAFPIAYVFLLTLDNSKDPAFQHAACKSRLIHLPSFFEVHPHMIQGSVTASFDIRFGFQFPYGHLVDSPSRDGAWERCAV